MENRRVVVYGRESCPNTNIQRNRLADIGVEHEYVDVDSVPDKKFIATPTTEVYDVDNNLVRRVVGLSYKLEKQYEELKEGE